MKILLRDLLPKFLFVTLTFLTISAAVLVTNPTTANATYNEECLNEDCDNEELEELFDTFWEECANEGCWAEEIREVSGGRLRGNLDFAKGMFTAFESRLGKNITVALDSSDPGETPDWDMFYSKAEKGVKVVKVVGEVAGVVYKIIALF